MSPVVLFTDTPTSYRVFSSFEEAASTQAWVTELDCSVVKNLHVRDVTKERQEGQEFLVKCLNYIQTSHLKTVNVWSDLGG